MADILPFREPSNLVREPPASPEAEQALLGAIILFDDVLRHVAPIVAAEHFSVGAHATIFETIQKLILAGRPVTQAALKVYLGDEKIGDLKAQDYIKQCVLSASTQVGARYDAAMIRDLYLRRQAIMIASSVIHEAYDLPVDTPVEQMLGNFEGAIEQLRPSRTEQRDYDRFEAVAERAVDIANEAYAHEGRLVGLSSGFPRLDDALGGLQPSDLVVLAGRPGMGKAQPLDAKVLTPQGFKRMGEIIVGETVCHPSGGTSKVLQIHPQGSKETFKITFADGRMTLATGDHLWAVRRRAKGASIEGIWTTLEIAARLERVRHRGRTSVPLASCSFGSDEALPIHPYALGLLLGDGRLGDTRIEFTSGDAQLFEELLRCLPVGIIFSVDRRSASGIRCASLRGEVKGQNGLRVALAALGLHAKRSADKFIPAAYLKANDAARLDMLRGLLDTDGTVEPSGTVRFCSVSRQLADDVAYLVRSLGGIAKISEKGAWYARGGERKHCQRAFIVSIRYPVARDLFRLTRKIERLPAAYQYSDLRLQIAAVEPAGLAECQCITVDASDGLYVTDEFIVTHNSALAGGIAVAVARDLQAKRQAGERTGVVAFNSLEMGAEQLVQRILAEQSDVSAWRLRRGHASEAEMTRFVHAAREMRALPLRIDESAGLTIGQLSLKARALKKRAGLELLIVDYLQLMSGPPTRRQRNRVEEVTEITGGLKQLAKELHVPILAISQLSRDVEKRDDRRPVLADLRESGSIEQDADIVMFVYREEYYRATEREPRAGTLEHQEWRARIDEVAGQAEVIVGKHRHGPARNVQLGYDGRLTRFLNDPPETKEAEAKSKKKKGISVGSKEGLVGLGLLRNLTMTHSLPNNGDVRGMPQNAKPVSYALWRAKCAEQMCDDPQDDKKVASLMVKVVTALGAAELIQRTANGGASESLCWLTDKGMG